MSVRCKGPGDTFVRTLVRGRQGDSCSVEIKCLYRIFLNGNGRHTRVIGDDALIEVPNESFHSSEFYHKRTFMIYGHSNFRPFLAGAKEW